MRFQQLRRMVSRSHSQNFDPIIRTIQSRVFEFIVASRVPHVVSIGSSYGALRYLNRSKGDLLQWPDANVEHFQPYFVNSKRELDIVALDPETGDITLYEVKDNHSPYSYLGGLDTHANQLDAFLAIKNQVGSHLHLIRYVVVFKNPIPDHIAQQVVARDPKSIEIFYFFIPQDYLKAGERENLMPIRYYRLNRYDFL